MRAQGTAAGDKETAERCLREQLRAVNARERQKCSSPCTHSMSITHGHDDGIKDLDRKRFDGQHQDMIRIKEARNKTKLVEDTPLGHISNWKRF